LYNRDGKYNIPPRSLATALRNAHIMQKWLKKGPVFSTTMLVCANFFKNGSNYSLLPRKIQKSIYCPPKFKSQSADQNQNSEANISNPFGSKFKTYLIQNSIFTQTLQVML